MLILSTAQDRCDDLMSLGYMLVYFLRGSLPWQNVDGPKKETEVQIMEMKKAISTEDLCEDLPSEFISYFKYVQSLEFDAIPNYFYLRKIFCVLFPREGMEYDNVYDWTIIKYLEFIRENEQAKGPPLETMV